MRQENFKRERQTEMLMTAEGKAMSLGYVDREVDIFADGAKWAHALLIPETAKLRREKLFFKQVVTTVLDRANREGDKALALYLEERLDILSGVDGAK